MADIALLDSPEIVTRKEAMRRGLTRYFTGRPCSKGHVDFRYTCDCMCAECARRKAKRQKSNPETVKRHQEARKRKYHSDPAYREKRIRDACRWAEDNRGERISYLREYYEANKCILSAADKERRERYKQDPSETEPDIGTTQRRSEATSVGVGQ